MHEQTLYSLVIQCTSRKQAGRAYDLVRNLIYLHPCDLTNVRFWMGGTFFVVVVGHPPDEPLRQKLEAVMGIVKAEPGQVDYGLLLYLDASRAKRLRGRTWAEASYTLPFLDES